MRTSPRLASSTKRPFPTFQTLAILSTSIFYSVAQASVVTSFGTFNMTFEGIGNPNNSADTTGDPNPAGSVGYAYWMGKYEVSEDMINKYNNQYGNANNLVITHNSYGADKPAGSVSWNEAARFTNWLNTSTGGHAAYKFTTSGVNDNIDLWTVADSLDYDLNNPYRSLRATYVLPSMNEWYKAAFYNPSANNYFGYAAGSNTPPTPVASGTAPNSAVYNGQLGPADITSAGGLSPYGIMGMNGNVYEWEETAYSLNNNSGSAIRGIRGGNWIDSPATFLMSSSRGTILPTYENATFGFRIASLSLPVSVPEGSPGCFAIFSTLGLLIVAHRIQKSPESPRPKPQHPSR